MGLISYFKVAPKAAEKPGKNGGDTVAAADIAEQRPTKLAAPSPYRQTWNGSRVSTRISTYMPADDGTKYHVVLAYIYREQQRLCWIHDHSGRLEGVMVRKDRTEYLYSPPGLENSTFARSMMTLNARAAMTISVHILKPFAQNLNHHKTLFANQIGIQILPEIEDLARASIYQSAAFIASEAILVVWDDNPDNLPLRAKATLANFVEYIWKNGVDDVEIADEKAIGMTEEEIDEESAREAGGERPIAYYHAFMIACTICLVMVLLGEGYMNIYLDIRSLNKWISLAFLAMTPINTFLGLFFAWVIISIVAQIIGPLSYLRANTKYYSAKPPPRLFNSARPHVTIQCPVYKEGLAAVIAPTIRSVKKAISTYELQGGSANIFVNDDGMQDMDEEDRQQRINFYEDQGIGWTARPKDGDDGFVRKGRFKKASNMNYGLRLSNKVEERLLQIDRPSDWTQQDEVVAYDRCLREVLEEDGRAWADGNIRVGDYILIIDSDTRIPADCLLDATSEMEQSPDVAILQFSSAVMLVSNSYFEAGIGFFTDLIYQAIRFGVSAGDVAPFVGHNAMLRWSAVQEVAQKDENGQENYWSESHVSEDFDLALRLQVWGYVVRMAAWAGDGFKEGVSLTVYDELARWEKYAYGCSELVFNPLSKWLYRGPFTPLFRLFITSTMPMGSKISLLAYIGTYYAIGAAWIMTTVNYVVVGFFNGYLDKFYVQSWNIWVGIVVVFSGAANVALAVQRYRLGQRSFLKALAENFMWAFMLIVFFGGISMHVSQALLCHLFGIHMSWGATSKEVETADFFTEVGKVVRKFKYSTAYSVFMIIAIIVMAYGPFIPWSWNINILIAIFPVTMLCVCHLLLPIALNPGLMTFSW